jgi:hypothetical protein
MKNYIIIVVVVFCSCNGLDNQKKDTSIKENSKIDNNRWVLIPNSTDCGEFYIDTLSMIYLNNERTLIEIWSKLVLNNTGKIFAENFLKKENIKNVSYTMALGKYDLKLRKHMSMEGLFYDSAGNLLFRDNGSDGWDNISPNSTGEATYNMIKEINKNYPVHN